jgi:thiamine-phosphate pyrophosphorylase
LIGIETFEIVAVTNRALCAGDFLEKVDALAEAGGSLMLREKDLAPDAYESLAREVLRRCEKHGAPFIVHGFAETAKRLGCARFHAPFSLLRQRPELCRELRPIRVGVSVHSIDEALFAAASGAASLVAGNVFETACKDGLEGRGIGFLAAVRARACIPVYAIGGVSEDNVVALRDAGASGACLMSSFMRSENPAACVERLRRALGVEAENETRAAADSRGAPRC